MKKVAISFLLFVLPIVYTHAEKFVDIYKIEGETIILKTDYRFKSTDPKICTVDTIWKKKIKDKSKAIEYIHYYLNLNPIPKNLWEGKEFVVTNIGWPNRVFIKPLNSEQAPYVWEFEEGDPVKIIVKNKSEALFNRYSAGQKPCYIYVGYGSGEFSGKEDHRAYQKVSCDSAVFWYSSYMNPKEEIFITQEDGENKIVAPSDLKTEEQYNGFKEKTLAKLREKGHYCFQLSKIEKPSNPAIRYGKSEEIPTEDGLSKFMYGDNVLSIIWTHTDDKFLFSLENKSANSLKIVWDEGAFIDENSQSSRIVHSGIPKGKISEPQPASIVAREAKLSDEIIPTERIGNHLIPKYYTYQPAREGKVKILFPVEIKGVLNEYVFTFDIVWGWDYPELRK